MVKDILGLAFATLDGTSQTDYANNFWAQFKQVACKHADVLSFPTYVLSGMSFKYAQLPRMRSKIGFTTMNGCMVRLLHVFKNCSRRFGLTKVSMDS